MNSPLPVLLNHTVHGMDVPQFVQPFFFGGLLAESGFSWSREAAVGVRAQGVLVSTFSFLREISHAAAR